MHVEFKEFKNKSFLGHAMSPFLSATAFKRAATRMVKAASPTACFISISRKRCMALLLGAETERIHGYLEDTANASIIVFLVLMWRLMDFSMMFTDLSVS